MMADNKGNLEIYAWASCKCYSCAIIKYEKELFPEKCITDKGRYSRRFLKYFIGGP